MAAIFIPTGNAGKLREFSHVFALQNMNCVGLKEAGDLLKSDFFWSTPIEDRQTFTGNGCRKLTASFSLLNHLIKHDVNSVLVDDSGLCVPRLNYLPGVNSAHLAGEPRDDAKNRSYLIELLAKQLQLDGEIKEPAFFVCSLLLASRIPEKKFNDLRNSTNCLFEDRDQLLIFLEKAEKDVFDRCLHRLALVPSAAYGWRSYLSDLCENSKGKNIYQIDCVMGFCGGFVSTREQELLPGEGHGYDAMFYPKARPQLSFASIPLSEKNSMSHRSEALRGLNEWVRSHTVQDGIQELF